MTLKAVAWETTRRCALSCKHCRGSARDLEYEGELSTEEGIRLIDGVAACGNVLLILTGGEPMSRPDIYDLARHASDRGLRAVMAPCGHLITPQTAVKMKEAGIRRISVSLDGATAAAHDAFRGAVGAFDAAIRGLRRAREAGIEFQVNTTVTGNNVAQLPAIHRLAVELGAAAMDFFFFVPTGRGAAFREYELSPDAMEKTLAWIHELSRSSPIPVKTTCAPQYARIAREASSGAGGKGAVTGARGCMAGRDFVFISHLGILQPCGFLDAAAGDLRKEQFDFKGICERSPVFRALRRLEDYHDGCRACEYVGVCGGCRARAYAHSGDYLGADPSCVRR